MDEQLIYTLHCPPTLSIARLHSPLPVYTLHCPSTLSIAHPKQNPLESITR